jgi:transcriptional regulator with XRE-family HTH domain
MPYLCAKQTTSKMTPEQIKAARLKAGLTRTQLGELAGLGTGKRANQRIYGYEANHRHPCASTRKLFQKIFAERLEVGTTV